MRGRHGTSILGREPNPQKVVHDVAQSAPVSLALPREADGAARGAGPLRHDLDGLVARDKLAVDVVGGLGDARVELLLVALIVLVQVLSGEAAFPVDVGGVEVVAAYFDDGHFGLLFVSHPVVDGAVLVVLRGEVGVAGPRFRREDVEDS